MTIAAGIVLLTAHLHAAAGGNHPYLLTTPSGVELAKKRIREELW